MKFTKETRRLRENSTSIISSMTNSSLPFSVSLCLRGELSFLFRRFLQSMKCTKETRRLRENSTSIISSMTNSSLPFSVSLCLRGELSFLSRRFLQPMRQLKLLRQPPRRQILPDVGQPLLHLEQRILKILPVADCNIAPHGIRTGDRKSTRLNSSHL